MINKYNYLNRLVDNSANNDWWALVATHAAKPGFRINRRAT